MPTKNRGIHGAALCVLLSIASASLAKVVFVDDDGPADFNNIQTAINGVKDGDTVMVADGIYTGPGNMNIDFGDKAITVRSSTGPENCIIDCQHQGRGFHFHSGEDANSVLNGFTITNGVVAYHGGGILCKSSSPTLMNCIFSNNFARGDGGGIFCESGSPTLIHCLFSRNLAHRNGGGMYNEGGKPTLIDCTFSENEAYEYGGGGICLANSDAIIRNCAVSRNSAAIEGGGIACWTSNPVIINCVITDNKTYGSYQGSYGDGAGITCWGSNPVLINCTIARNQAHGIGGGVSSRYKSRPIITHCTIADNSAAQYGGAVGCERSYAVIKGSILYGNTAGNPDQLSAIGFEGEPSDIIATFSDVQLGWPGEGNIDADPRFIDHDNGDYRLSSSSHCIDAGGPYYHLFGQHFADAQGHCRLAGEFPDMGSNEFASSPDSDADLSSDVDEITYGSNPNDPDTDADGLLDGIESLRGTDPAAANSPTGVSVPTHYPAVQQALFLAFPLETVTVAPGTYYENIHFQGKDLTLKSIDPTDSEIVETTILDANEIGTVVTFSGAENSSCVLSGFTITRGGFSGINGNGCGAVVENCKILLNFCPSKGGNRGGGGMFNCDGVIQNNIISGNRATESGGGIEGCDGKIHNNIISNNSCGYLGGGISRCKGLITQNVMTTNTGGYAAGIYCDGGRGAMIANCLIAGNYGGGIYGGSDDLTVSNCTITANGGGIRWTYGRLTVSELSHFLNGHEKL